MSGRRADDERGEVFQGGGSGTAGREREIGVGAAVLGADPGRSSADPRAVRGGNPSSGGGPVVPVAVPGAVGAADEAAVDRAARSQAAFDAFGGAKEATDAADVTHAEDSADHGAAPLRTDSATRLNAGRISPTGADRGGHVHRVDVPKTPAQGGDRDALSPAEIRSQNDGGQAADQLGADPADGAAADPEELARLADLTGLAGPELVGRRLHLARRHAGLSVEDVTAVTRIRGTMIRQIEAGDFSRSGGEVYARGHVRSLAKAVGLDAEELLGAVPVLVVAAPPAVRPSASAPVSAPQPKSRATEDKAQAETASSRTRIVRSAKVSGVASTGALVAGSAAPAPAGPEGSASGTILPVPVDPSDVITREPKSANWTAAMVVVLLGLVVFAGMQLIGDDKPTPTQAAAHVPPPVAAKPVPPPAPAPTPTGVAVKVAASGADSWLAVFSADGRKLYDNLLAAGSAQSFQDKAKLEVIVGNAAAIKLQLNGKDMAPIGGDGQVVRVLVNPTGVVQG